MKICKDCGVEKPMSEYYLHKGMMDGHLNQCKKCVRERVSNNVKKNSEYYKKYEQERNKLPSRVQARKEYRQTERGKIYVANARANFKKKFPMKHACHVIVSCALRNGSIKKETKCSECQSSKNVQAHHDDYTKPLSVRWLCSFCHSKWHQSNKAIYE
jgi:hypothetical protein